MNTWEKIQKKKERKRNIAHTHNYILIKKYGATLLSDIPLSNSASLLISTEAPYLPLLMDFSELFLKLQKLVEGSFQSEPYTM